MEEIERDGRWRGYALIKVLGIAVLAFLLLVSIAGAAPFAYIPNNWNTYAVSVIDTATDEVTATVPVGKVPQGVAVNSEGTKVYITNSNSGTVSVIDTSTNTVIATVPVGISPLGVAVTPDGNKVYVANSYSNTVSVIDTSANTVIATVDIGRTPEGASNSPSGVAITADGSKVYVSNDAYGEGTVSVINTSSDTVATKLYVGLKPRGIAVNFAGTKVYVGNTRSNTVSVIDTTKNQVIDTVNIGSTPDGLAVTPDGSKVYVTKPYESTVCIIDTETNQVTDTLSTGSGTFPSGISVTPDGKEVYVTTGYSISIIDTETNAISTMNLGVSIGAFGQFIGPLTARPVFPLANFSSNVTQGYAPLSVQFTDFSENSTLRNWDFNGGDGIIDSTEENPVYVYQNPGTYIANLTVSNENGTDSKTATINVWPAPLKSPIITWNNPADITFGTSLSSTQLNAAATDPVSGDPVAGTFTYKPAAGTVLNAGMGQTLHVDFVPSDTTKYNVSSKEVTINVQKAIPEITWNNPDDIIFGTELSNTQLNASASVPGTFVYNKQLGDILDVGTHTLHVDFTPSDAVNYTSASKEVTINVLEKPVAPVANFSASPTTGKASFTVTFTDSSTGSPKSWYWNFGDKTISTSQNPVHTYSKQGKYTVSLTVENAAGSNTKTISKYITVEKVSKKK